MVSAKLLVFACLIAVGSSSLLNVGLNINLGSLLNGVFGVLSGLGLVVKNLLSGLLNFKNPTDLNSVLCLGVDIAEGTGAVVTVDVNLKSVGDLLGSLIGCLTTITLCVLSPVASQNAYCTKGYKGKGPWIGYTKNQISEIIDAYGVRGCRSKIENVITQNGGIDGTSRGKILEIALNLAKILDLNVDISVQDYRRCLKQTFIGLGAVYYSYSNGDQKRCDQLIEGLVGQCSQYLEQSNIGGFTQQDLIDIKAQVSLFANDGAVWSNKCKACKS